MMTAQALALCIFAASQTYAVPAPVLLGILHVEGGRVGQAVPNTNGTHDLGPMQINTLWLPTLAKNWKVSEKTAMEWVRDDGCTNVNVSAWILRQNLNATNGSLAMAVAYYHSRTPSLGSKYKSKVVEVMRRKGLLSGPVPKATSETASNPPKPPAKRIQVGRFDQVEDKG